MCAEPISAAKRLSNTAVLIEREATATSARDPTDDVEHGGRHKQRCRVSPGPPPVPPETARRISLSRCDASATETVTMYVKGFDKNG